MDGNDNKADDFVLTPKEIKEVKLCQATGAQARIMTFLQGTLTLLFGSQFVHYSRPEGFIDDKEVSEWLVGIRMCSASYSQSGNTPGDCPTEDGKSMHPATENRNGKYKSLLEHLRKLEESFVACRKAMKSTCETIRKSLLAIDDLFDQIAVAQSTEETQEKRIVQRSIVTDRVIKFLKNEVESLTKLKNFPEFGDEQFKVLGKLIPQLNIMVVSDIIASYDLSMAELECAAHYFLLFVKLDVPQFSTRHVTFKRRVDWAKRVFFERCVDCARHQRNWSSDTHEVKTDDHVKFLEHAQRIVEFLEPWFVDPDTDSFRKKSPDDKNRYPSFVYPGLREEYFLRFARNMLSSHYVLTEVIDRVVKLSKENELITKRLAEIDQQLKENQQLKERDRQLDEKDEQLAKETEEKEKLEKLCMGTKSPPQANVGGAAKGNPPSGSADPQLPDNDIPEVSEGMQDMQLQPTARPRNRKKKKTPSQPSEASSAEGQEMLQDLTDETNAKVTAN